MTSLNWEEMYTPTLKHWYQPAAAYHWGQSDVYMGQSVWGGMRQIRGRHTSDLGRGRLPKAEQKEEVYRIVLYRNNSSWDKTLQNSLMGQCLDFIV